MSTNDHPATDARTDRRTTNAVDFTLKLGHLRARNPNAAEALVDGAFALVQENDQEAADALEDAATRLRGGANK